MYIWYMQLKKDDCNREDNLMLIHNMYVFFQEFTRCTNDKAGLL